LFYFSNSICSWQRGRFVVRDAIVIGAGIVGATITKTLIAAGRQVLLVDSGREMAGTKPSGGHLKPSWFSGMKKAEYEPAMELLDQTWGLFSESFVIKPVMMATTVYRVDTDVVVAYPYTQGNVTSIDMLDNIPRIKYSSKKEENVEERTRLLVVAAGKWCAELLPEVFANNPVIPKRGISFRFTGTTAPFIKPWAPYKQIVAHQQGNNEIWIGDGSAILEENWTEDRTQQCLTRCQSSFKGAKLIRSITGVRPYCKTNGDPCLLSQVGKHCWVATGAGKSGTIAAGWAARRILDATN
jgi:glycine/D-amino acid oxidase-like deaminating enzyme